MKGTSDIIAGYLQVGTDGKGNVVINHPKLEVDKDGIGFILFSPKQARSLADKLTRKALLAEAGE